MTIWSVKPRVQYCLVLFISTSTLSYYTGRGRIFYVAILQLTVMITVILITQLIDALTSASISTTRLHGFYLVIYNSITTGHHDHSYDGPSGKSHTAPGYQLTFNFPNLRPLPYPHNGFTVSITSAAISYQAIIITVLPQPPL